IDVQTGKDTLPASGPQAPLNGLALTSDGKRIVTVTAIGKIYPWTTENGKLGKPWVAADHISELGIAVAPDNKTLATAGRAVTLWDLTDDKVEVELPRKDGDFALSVRFSPDGKRLAVGLRGQQLEIWDVAEKKLLHQLKHPAPV